MSTYRSDPETLRIEGGYFAALRATISGWWNHLFILTGLNLLWIVALLSIIAAAPATATYFYIARQVLLQDIHFDWRSFLTPFRRYFFYAWAWAVTAFLLVAVGVANLWLYRDVSGLFWSVLRWLWSSIVLLWMTINLFFWPLWYAQEPGYRTLRTTWRNGFAFLVTNPLPALLTTLIIVALGIISALTGVLLGTIFMAWTTLLVTAVLAAYLPPAGE